MDDMTFTYKRHTVNIPLFLFTGFILLNGCVSTPQALRSFPTPESAKIGINEGMQCPNLVFQDGNGQQKELKDFRGKVVFLNFWASWCIPCHQEMPSIQKLYNALKNDDGIVFIMLATDKDYKESMQYAKSSGYDLPVYKNIPQGNKRVDIRNLPTTLILDRNGIVIKSKTGKEYWQFWLERIQDLIRTSALTIPRHYSYPADEVQVEVEVEEGKPSSSLHVSFVAKSGVKLSAKRGIDITPVENNFIRWVTPMPPDFDSDR